MNAEQDDAGSQEMRTKRSPGKENPATSSPDVWEGLHQVTYEVTQVLETTQF